MPYSKDKTIPAIAGKSDKVKEVFAEAANSALSKGQDEQSAVFAGLAAVKNYEKKQGVAKSIIGHHAHPTHVLAISEARKAKELSKVVETQEVVQDLPDFVVSVAVDSLSRIVATYDSGKKTTSKPVATDVTEIRNTIIANQPVQKYAEPLTSLVGGLPEIVFTTEGEVLMQLIEMD